MANKKDLPQWVINQYERNKSYQQQNIRQYKIKFNYKTEQNMIDFLDTKPNKSGYIKELIKKDMKKHGG